MLAQVGKKPQKNLQWSENKNIAVNTFFMIMNNHFAGPEINCTAVDIYLSAQKPYLIATNTLRVRENS